MLVADRAAHRDQERFPGRWRQAGEHFNRHLEQPLEVDRVETFLFVEADLGQPELCQLRYALVRKLPGQVEAERPRSVRILSEICHGVPPGDCIFAQSASSRSTTGWS